MPKATVEQVNAALDSEREYQRLKWGEHEVEVASFVTFMQHHMTRAIAEVSTNTHDRMALEQVRKITALGRACMEQHGAPMRDVDEAKARGLG